MKKICITKPGNVVLHVEEEMDFDPANGLSTLWFHSPSLTHKNSAIYEVESVPDPFGLGWYTFDPKSKTFALTEKGIEEKKELDMEHARREASKNIRELETNCAFVIGWLSSALIEKGILPAGEIPAEVQDWLSQRENLKQTIADNDYEKIQREEAEAKSERKSKDNSD